MVEKLDHSIVVVKEKYITKDHEVFQLSTSKVEKYKYLISDENDKELFNCKIHNLGDPSIIKDANDKDNIHFTMHNSLDFSKSKVNFSVSEEKTKDQTITFTYRRSTKERKYLIEFSNEKGFNEVLDAVEDNNKEFTIYYGKKSSEGIPICKVKRESSLSHNCTFELEPGLDKVLFITIIIYIIFLFEQC